MGLLTDLFVSTAEDARQFGALVAEGSLPADRFSSVEFGGMTNLQFEILWSLIEGRDWDPDQHGLEQVVTGRDDGVAWTFQFPAAFVDCLAGLQPASLPGLSKQWASAEELSADPADVRPIIESAIDLARLSKSRRQGMFLWVSM